MQSFTEEPDKIITRFAPSPSGRMHAGNIYASLIAWLCAQSSGGEVVLRIEDLDRERSKKEYINAIQRDYESLGLFWDKGPYFQHNRDNIYEDAFKYLQSKNLIYPCFCTRAEIITQAPHFGEKQVYAGTCRMLSQEEVLDKSKHRQPGFRLVVEDKEIIFDDIIQGPYRQNLKYECGDFLVKRSDGAFAYQLAVVIDDAEQGINFVCRGVDLLCSTPQQIYLSSILGYSQPQYAHVPLLVSQLNKRLSKRDKSASLDEMFVQYKSAAGVIGHIAYTCGLIEEDIPVEANELIKDFSIEKFTQNLRDKVQIVWKP